MPAIVQAVVIAQVVGGIGGLPPALFLFGNLRFLPAIPWLLPATALWLWLFWRYCSGLGWPASTAPVRRRDLRGGPLTGRVWCWALLAGALGMVSIDALAFLTPRLVAFPKEAFAAPIALSALPPWMLVAFLLAISAVAGVVEEVTYRGYVLSRIQHRHGWLIGLIVSGLLFFLDHYFSHAYATIAFLPFFLAVSILHGALVYLTGSIRPSILLHAVADFVVLPIQFGIVGHPSLSPVWRGGFDASFLVNVGVLVGFALAAWPTFNQLARVARVERVRCGRAAAE